MTSTPVVRIKYSPDQPRDHGRFAETEGGGEDASSEGANQSGGGKAPSSWTSLSAPQIKVREEIAAAGLSLRHYDEMPEEEKGFLKDAGYSMWAGDKPASEATLKGIRDAAQTLAQVAPEVMKGFKEAGLRVFEARMDEDTVQMLAFRTSNDGSITPAIVINTNHSAIRSMIVGGASGSQSSRAANEELSKGGTPHQVALVSAKVGFLHETGHLVDMASKSELSKQFDRALRTAAAKEHQLPNTYTTLHLGEYANTSRAEAFAEVFASRVRTGSLPPGMSKFGETLDRVLKGQGKKSFVVKYSEDQERDDHGRFSGSGGASGGGSGSSAEHVETVAEGTSTWSATAPADSKDLSKAKERIASLLGPVEGLESLPEQVLLRLRALPATPTAEHAEMLEGVADALQSLQADFPGYGEMLKEAGTRFVLVNYEPKHAAMTAVTAPGEAPRLLVNTNHNSVEGLGTDSAWSVGAVMAGEALKGGLSLRAAVRLEAKICLYHEVGHIVDRASDGMLTEGFGANLLMTKGVTEKNASRWVEKHVSGYASTSPREGAAEEFSKILAGKHTAGLEQFAALVRRSGAPRVSKRSSRSLRRKYSPDQPRDHGRFAESEGESGPASQPLSSEQEATFRRLQEADRKLRAAVDPTATGERQMLQFFGGMGREQLEAAGMFSRAALVGELGVQEPVTAGTPRMTPQRCYDNAAEKSLAGYTYIEGNVFVHGIPIAHAWNVKDGKAIDFTIPDAAKWQYIGVKVPQDVVERVITSRHFPDADDGILGAINLFKPTERAKLIAKVRAANTPQKGLVVRVKYSPDQPRDHGRFAEVEGDSGESGSGGKDPIKQGTKFDRLAWGAKPMMEARGEWKKLSNYERDMLADPTHSVEARIDDLTGGKDVPKTGEALKDISSRVDQFRGDMLVDRSADAITEFSSKAYTSLVAAGCKPEAARELALTVADYTIAQDFEAAGRSLGDHGEHHLSENARIANEVLSAAGLNNARTESLVQLAAAFHDAGYLTEPSRVFLDETHARWSAQNYQANIAPKVEAAMGKEFSRDLASLIYAHDDTLLDWNTAPLQSAFSLADNLALFHYEKMPAMMRYVPANTGVLVALARGKLDVAAAQVAMRANIASSNLPKALKTQLNNATHEVSGVLPKFTLGMVGVKMTRASWDKDHPVIHIQRYRSNEALSKVVDFGQKQFGKLAETYGGDPKAFIASGSMELNDTAGHHLLSLVISSGRKKSFGDFLRAVFKYSPDQPRDHGRFAESEGESGGREEPASSSAGRAAADKPAVLHSAWHDNPGGSWEEHERRYAQQEWEKGRKVVGSPTAGIEGRLPTLLVAELPGLLDEHRLPGILHDPKSQAIKDSVRQVGVLEPIFINVNHLGLAYINEGNHRAALARFFGHKTVPVEVRYFAGGEKIEKAWNLERLQSRYAKSLGSLLRKYSDSQERDERGRWTDDGGGEGNVTEPQLPAPGSRDSKLPRLNVSPQKADLAIDSALVQLEKHVAKNPGTEVMVAVPANKPAADWVAVHLRNANDPYFLAVGEGGRVEPSYNADLAFRVGSSEFVDPKTGEKALWDVVHNHLQEKSQVTEPFSMLDYTTFHKSEGIRTLTAKSFEGSVYTLQMTTKLASAAPFNPINEVRVSDFADSSQKVQEALYVQLRSRVGGERDREKLKPWVAEHNAAVQHSLGIVYDKLGWMQYRTRLSPAAEKHYAEKKQFINDLVRDTLKSLPQNLRDPYSKRPSSYVEPLKSLGAMLRKYREDQPRDHGRFAETEGGDDGDSGSGTQSGGAAELTGLHYDKGGKRWMRSDGKPASEETDARLRALGMPPAYTDVKLNPDPTEPLQATGVAANGKTQYKFLKEHTEQAAAENFARLRDFNKVASSVRAKLGKEMKDVNLPTSRRDAAAALLLIDKSAIRVGGEGETRAAVKAYGATTLLGKHVTLGAEGKIDLEFPGKSGQVNRATFKDVVLHRYLSEKGLKANARVFATTDRGARLAMTRAAGEGYTPKDFRTWIGTATALREVAKAPIPKTKSEYRHQRIAVSKVVAAKLNNTPAMALKAYIDPAVFKRWEGARP